MASLNKNVISKNKTIEPFSSKCYSHGWIQMKKYFFELLLILIVSLIISVPTWGLGVMKRMNEYPFVFFVFIFALAYVVLIDWIVEYGVDYAFLKAARGDTLEVGDMFFAFQNYGNVILANILTSFIIGIGFMLFFIPGIVFACKLAFVPYLVVDKKMDAISAVKESWRLTNGHSFTVFLIGFIAIFIGLVGLLCFVVGVIVSIIWIKLAFASLYVAVTRTGVKI